ncbi:MAG: S9 family peptidase [Sediminibacterium sp.]|nr:S9 family peptidase [Sediminibacterium sp.]
MKRIILIACIAVQAVVALAQQKITLEDLWVKYAFYPKAAGGFNALNDGLYYTDIEEVEKDKVLCKYELKSGKKTGDVVRQSQIRFENKELNLTTYAFSPNEDKLLLHENMENVYRRSPKANYFIYDLKSGKVSQLDAAGKQFFPHFSPDGKKVAYVRDNNLYIKNLENESTTEVTNDGKWNVIKNGWADWVYEEEFSKADYFDWSADSKYLAFVKFDERHVKEYSMDMYNGNLYPDKYTFKYPKAGEDNSIVSVHIYDVAAGKSRSIDIGDEVDIYIPRIQYTNDANTLCVQRMNRLQNKIELLFVNSQNGSSKVVLTEEAKTYIDVHDNLTFVGNKGFIWSSEMDEFNHLYYYDLNGKLINRITSGNWDVIEFKGFDEKTNTVYYISTENGAINRDVYSVKLDGKGKVRLSAQDGTTDANFANGFKYYVSTYSNGNTPPVYELRSSNGKLVKVLEDNAALRDKLKQYTFSKKEFFKFNTSEGVELNGFMIKPADFDPNKKYPVYMYAYNGPGANECNNAWDAFEMPWHQILAQNGYIVVCVDGRGTFGRGRVFKHSTYLQLGKLEVTDQLEVAKYMGNQPYVDKNRIGFQGWSYGGYMASLMITKGADLIKTAIAVAPVTNWKYYDNIYTERFMRKPKDNTSGYEDNSPVNHAKKLKGNFLLIHGSADDNVHYQNSMELAKELIKYNKPFEFMTYPNKNHGISGGLTRLHIYSKILNFVKEKL